MSETCSRLTSKFWLILSDLLKFFRKFTKKWDLSPDFFVSDVSLYPCVRPKSKVRLASLNACLYSPKNRGCSDTKSLLFIVKSLSLLIAQK